MTDLSDTPLEELADAIEPSTSWAYERFAELVRRARARDRFEALWEQELERAKNAESEGFADKLARHAAEKERDEARELLEQAEVDTERKVNADMRAKLEEYKTRAEAAEANTLTPEEARELLSVQMPLPRCYPAYPLARAALAKLERIAERRKDV